MAKIEERILSMRFDNAQFKRAAADTQKDLNNLKKGLKLDGVKSGLDGVAKASSKSLGSIASNASKINLSPLVQSVDEVGRSFTALEAISFGALASIGGIAVNKAISGVKKLTNMIVNPIMQGGMNRARNLEQANFMLSGLFSKLDDQARKSKIDEVMAAANNSVTGTAFGLDEAAKAAAQLTASQVPMDKLEGSLRGIAGTASMTGSGFEEIANIFTTVAGNGRMMGQELGMLSARGLNAAASIGQHLGVTEAEVREMASKGKISFEIFSDAMEGAFGAQAARANETYSGSLSNLKAALGRIGADVATVYLEKMRDLFNELRPAVNAVHGVLKPFIGLLNDRFRASIDSVIRPIKTFTTALEQFNETGVSSSKGWTTFFKLMQDIGMIASLVADVVRDAIGVMFGASPRFIEMSNTVTSAGTKIQHIFRKLLSVLMLGPEIIGAIFKAVLGLSDSTGSFGGTLLDIIDHFASMLYLMAEWIRESTIIQTVVGVIAFGIRMVLKVATAAGKVLGFFVGLIAKLYHAMDPVFSGIFRLISKVKGILESFFGTLKDFSVSTITKIGKSITSWFGRIFDSIKSFDLKDLWKSIKSFRLPKINLSQFKGLEGIISTITRGIDRLKGFVGGIDWSPLTNAFQNYQLPNLGDVSSFAKGIGGQIKTGFGNINADGIKNFASNVAIHARNAGEFIRNVDYAGIWETVKNTFIRGAQATASGIKSFGTWVSEAIRNVDWKAVGSTIVEGFTTAVKMIVNAADSIGTFISDMFTSAMDSVDWGGIVDGFKDFGEGVKESFTGIFDSFKDAKIDTSSIDNAVAASTQDVTVKVEADLNTKAKGIKETIGDFFGALFGTGPAISAEDSELIAGTKDFGAKVSGIAGAIKSPFATAKAAVMGEVGSFGETMKSTATGLLEGVNLVEILNGIGLAFTGAGIFSLAESVEKLAAVPEALTGAIKEVGNSFKAMGDSFKKIGDAAKIEAQGNAILKIAGAVVILAAAVWFMSKIPWDQMKVGLGAVLGLLAGLVAAVVILDKTISEEGSAKIDSLSNAMMKMGIAIGIMAAAVWILGNMDPKTIFQGLAAALGTILVLAAGVGIAGMTKSLTGMGTAFMGLALGVAILAGAFILFKFINWDEIAKGLTTLGVAVLAISFAARIADGKKLAGAGLAMLGLGTGLLALAYGLKAIAALDEQQLTQGLLVLGGVMVAITLMSRFGGKLTTTAGALVGVAFAMVGLAYAIGLIADIDFWDAAGGMAVIALGMIGLGLAMRAFPKDMPKIAGSLLSIAGAIAILVGAIWVIGNMDPAVVWQGVGVLAVALGGLALALNTMKPTAGKDMMILGAGMVVLSASMVVLAYAMNMFNDVEWDSLQKAGLVLGGFLVTLGLMGWLGAAVAPGISALGGALAIFGGGLLVIAAAAWVFADAVSKIVDSLNNLKDSGTQIKDALKEVGEGITLFADEAKAGFESLFDTIGLTDLPKIGSLVKLLNSFGDIPSGMDVRLKELADGMKSLESTIPIIESLANVTNDGGKHLASFFNSFSDIEPDAGDNLKSLANTIKGFDDGFFTILQRLIDLGPKKRDAKELSKFFRAFDDLEADTGENLLSLTNTFKGFDDDFFNIVQRLIDLGPTTRDAKELSKFFRAFDDLEADTAENLLSLTNTFRGFDDDFFNIVQRLIDLGPTTRDAKELSKFFRAFDDLEADTGANLLSLTNTFKGFDDDFFNIVQRLIDLGPKPSDATELTNFFGAFGSIGEGSGGNLKTLASTFNGFDDDFFTIVQRLIDLGPKYSDAVELTNFFGAFNDINEDSGDKLRSLANTFKGFDDGFFTIVQRLIDLGPKHSDAVELTNFFSAFDDIGEESGRNLRSLANTFKGFDDGFFTIVQRLIDLGPKHRDAVELATFFGAFDNINEDAGDKLRPLVNVLKQFDEGFFGILESLTTFEGDASSIVNLFTSIGDSVTEDMGHNIADVVTGIEDIGYVIPDLKESIESLKGLDVEGLSDSMTNIGEAFNSGVGEGLSVVADEFRAAIDSALAAITDRSSEFNTAGQDLGGGLATGIDDKKIDTGNAGRNISEAAASAAKDARSSMVASGKYVAEGLAEGIRQGTEAAVTAAREMANRVAAVAREALDEHSPSRVFMEIGQFVSQGFAIGITKDSHLAANAVSDSMDDAINAADIKTGKLKNSTSGFYDTLIKGISNNPLTKRLETLARHSKAAHATAVKERKIEDMEKLERAEEERKKIYKDVEEAKKGVAEAKEETKTAQNETKQAEKDAKDSASDSAKSAKDAQKQKEKITDAEEKYQKALRERDKYEYRMHGEEAGVAFVDGVAVGMMDNTEAIPSVAEILSELIVEDVENIKDEVGNYGDIFGGFSTALKTTKSMGDNVRDISRAFNRLSNATSPRSIERNIGKILDSVVEFSGGIQDLIGLISVFEPFLPGLLDAFEASLPGIAAAIAPFAPQLAATLGGGLTAALPAIAGPVGAIIAAIAGIGLFLNDQSNGGNILKGLEKMFKGVLKFIASLPKRMLGMIKVMLDGLKKTIKDLPRIMTVLIDGMVGFIIDMVDVIPEVIPELVNAIIEVVAWIVLNAPAIILEIGAALVMGLVRGLNSAIKSLIRLLLSPFEWLTGRIGGKMDLVGIGVAAIKSLGEGFDTAVRATLRLILWPFEQIFNFIGGIFGMSQLGTNLVNNFETAIVNAMRFAVDAIAFPFIGLWNLIAGIFGWKQLSYNTASDFIFGTSKGIDSGKDKVRNSAENINRMMYEYMKHGAKNNLADVAGYVDDYMKLVETGMVSGVEMGSDATRNVADKAWADIEKIFDMYGLGQDELDALTEAFYEGTTNPDTIVSSFGDVYDRIEELLAMKGVGPEMVEDLNKGLNASIRQGMLDEAMAGFGKFGTNSAALLTDSMVLEMGLSKDQIVAASDDVWRNIEDVFDMAGLGKDEVDALRKAYEDGTRDPATFVSTFDTVFEQIEKKLRLAGMGEEQIAALKYSMSTAIEKQLNPELDEKTNETKGIFEGIFNSEEGKSLGESIVDGIMSALTSPFQKIWDTGVRWVGNLVGGVESVLTTVFNVGITLANLALSGLGSIWDGAKGIFHTGVRFVGSLVSGITSVLTTVFNVAGTLASQALSGLGSIWDGAKGIFSRGVSFVNNLVGGINSVLTTVFNVGKSIGSRALSGLGSIWDGAKGIFSRGVSFVNNLASGVNSVIGNVTNFGKDIGNRALSAIGSIWDGAKGIFHKGVSFVGSLVSGVNSVISKVTTFGKDIGNRALNAIGSIWDGAKGIFSRGVSFVGSLVSGVNSVIGNVTNFGKDIGNRALNALGSIWDGTKGVFSRGVNFVTNVVGGINSILARVTTVGTSVGNAAINALRSVWNGANGAYSRGVSFITNVVGGINSILARVTTVGTSVGDTALNALRSVWNGLNGIYSIGVSFVTNVVGGINSILARVTTVGTSVGNAAINALRSVWNGANGIYQRGVSFVTNVVGGINSILPRVTTVGKSVGDTALNALGSVWNGTKGIFSRGADFIGELIRGMTGSLGNVSKIGRTIANNALDALWTIWNGTKGIFSRGVDFVGGLINGIQNQFGRFAQEVKKLAKRALDLIGLGWLIRSPSRRAMELSAYLVEGLVLGITNNASDLDDAVGTMGGDVLDTTRDIIAQIAEAMELDSDVTITPVIDLTNARKGMRDLSGMLESGSINIDTTTSASGLNDLSALLDGSESGYGSVTNVTNIEFNQTNTSPEPLSAYEVYQNTDRSLKTLTLSGPNR